MNVGDRIQTNKVIRSQKTGLVLPREGEIVGQVVNMGRQMLLVDFGSDRREYLFPGEIELTQPKAA